MTGARPRLSSSSSRSLGWRASARPTASICCSPPDSRPQRRSRSGSQRREVPVRDGRVETLAAVAEPEVLGDREAEEQAAVLGDVRDAELRPRARLHARQVLPLESGSPPLHRTHEPGDGAERRRLAGAVRSEERDDLARRDRRGRGRGRPPRRRSRRSDRRSRAPARSRRPPSHRARVSARPASRPPRRHPTAEVGRHHARVAAHVVRRPRRDHLAELEHDDTVADAHAPGPCRGRSGASSSRRRRSRAAADRAPRSRSCRARPRARRGRGAAARSRSPAPTPTSFRCPWVSSSGIASAIGLEAEHARGPRRAAALSSAAPSDQLGRQRQERRALGRDGEVLSHGEVVEELGALPGAGEAAPRAHVRRQPDEVAPVELDAARASGRSP